MPKIMRQYFISKCLTAEPLTHPPIDWPNANPIVGPHLVEQKSLDRLDMDTIEPATNAAAAAPISVKEQEPVVAVAAVADIALSNGHHVDDSAEAVASDVTSPVVQPRSFVDVAPISALVVPPPVTGLLSLPENVQHAVKEFALLDGYSFFATRILSVDGNVTKAQLLGEKQVNGFNLADVELKLVITVDGDVVKVSKDYFVEAVPLVEVVAAPVIEEVAVPVVEEVAAPVVEEVAAPIVAEAVVASISVDEIVTPVVETVAAQPIITLDPTPTPKGSPLYIQRAIEKVATDQGFITYTTDVISNFAAGDGFIGELSRVKLIGNQTVNGVTYADSELSLIVKTTSRQDPLSLKLFEREVFAYTQILPTFAQFQLDHGLKPGSAGFHAYPKCYYAHFDGPAEETVIIMEDLNERGFSLENKQRSLEYSFAKLVLEQLAELHGISLAMKQQRPEEFARFKELSDLMVVDLDEVTSELVNTFIESATGKAIATLGEHETVLKEKVKRVVKNMNGERDRYRGELSEPYSVINHGDCWTNNMMFKYESGQQLKVILYDWQFARYSSPVLDLVYFLFLCTDTALRAKHYDDLIQAYHHALRAQLERLGADVNELFPFTAMLRQLKAYGRYSLGRTLIGLNVICAERADIPDVNELTEKLKNGTNLEDVFTLNEAAQSSYTDRMSGVLRDLNRKGFLG